MLRRLCFVSFIVSLMVTNLNAQSTNATITGRVTDQSKAAIAGARVIATNVDTGVQQAVSTGSEGMYSIGALIPGSYKLEIEKTGFKTIIKPDLILHVQDVATINFGMSVGSVSESITVSGGAPLVDTESSSVSTVVDRQFAENLPLNGRSFQTLIQLTPGVVLVTSNGGSGQGSDSGQFSVNGQRASSNYWMVDGVSANIGIGIPGGISPGNGLAGALGSFSAMGGTNSLVSVDAMQEFRIQTSTYAPEFGRTPGGQISIVTRSGTNQFHGTAFDYLRNDLFDANDWFADNKGLDKPKERQNDFGGTVSGPILKDRTFFFFSYEGLRLRLPQTTLTTVPDLAARQNAVPAMQSFLNAYPLPNGADNTVTSIAQFNASYSNPASLDAYSLRIDHKLTDRWSLFARYNYSPSEFVDRGGSSGLPALSVVQPFRITTQTATAGATWIISPRIANELRLNYSRTNASSRYDMDNFGGAVPLQSLPFPGSFTSQNALLNLFILPLQQSHLYSGELERNTQRQFNLVDSLSLQEGSHSLKFGVDSRRLSPINEIFSYSQAALFLSVSSADQGNLFLKQLASFTSPTFLFRNLGIYAQDTWRVEPRLTLTYGVRWDIDFVPKSTSGPSLSAATGFNLNDLSALALAPAGTPPYQTRYINFAPRLGLAYQLVRSQNWQTVLRGGFGVFYDLASSEVGNSIAGGQYPFGALATTLGGTFPLNASTAAPPNIMVPSASNYETLYAFDPHLELPYTLEWNVALEQAMGNDQTLSLSYIGASGKRLLQTAFVSPPNASLQSAQLVSNSGMSNYNALQLQLQRRLSYGLQALASYTWSHSIDTGSAGSLAVGSNASTPSAIAGSSRGPSDFDVRQGLSVGLTYDVPTLKSNHLTEAVLRGWSLENIVQVRSEPPVDVSVGDLSLASLRGDSGFSGSVRPDLVPGQPLYLNGSQYPGGKAFNPAAFTNPPIDPQTGNLLRNGDLSRNFLRGFDAAQWDFAVHRNFPIHESLQLQFRAELFNVLNHPNFGQPSGSFGQGGFGLSSQMLGRSLSGGNLGGGAFSPLYQMGGPRSVQFALKATF
jgi:hypothetical protein